MTEAVDDIPAIVAACDRFAIVRRRIHVDAALSGLPLMREPVTRCPTGGLYEIGPSRSFHKPIM